MLIVYIVGRILVKGDTG